MRNVLFIVPNLAHNAFSTQVAHFSSSLVSAGFDCHVFSLRGAGPAISFLKPQGIRMAASSGKRRSGVLAGFELRKLVRNLDPFLIHVFGVESLRYSALAAGRPACHLWVSRPLTPTNRGYKITPWDRRLVNSSDQIFVSSESEAYACRQKRLTSEKIVVHSPCRTSKAQLKEASDQKFHYDGCNILCAGPLDHGKGYEEAIWAFDVLRHHNSDARLTIAGEGPVLPRLKRFAKNIGIEKIVRFPGCLESLDDELERADIVWVPTKIERGKHFLAEAMAKGKPIVASALPGIAELIIDGESGFLTTPGDKVALCRKTRLLAEDADLRREIGNAAYERMQSLTVEFRCQNFYRAEIERIAA